MDSTFDPLTEEIVHIRQNISFPDQIAPVLHLVALNTIEHIIPCSKDEQNLAAAVEAVKILRNDAGVVEKHYGDALGDGPKRVGTWIAGGCQGDPPLPPLPDLPLYELATQTQTQTQQQTQQVEAQQPLSSALVHLPEAPTQPRAPKPVVVEKNTHPTSVTVTTHSPRYSPDLSELQDRQAALKADKRKREVSYLHLSA